MSTTTRPDPIFGTYVFGQAERSRMDRDGHIVFPDLLTDSAGSRLVDSLRRIESLRPTEREGHEARKYSAEHDPYLESLISHPQMLELARSILGEDIRYDHCVSLTRLQDDRGTSWHAHSYGEENWDLNLGFVRIFFYVNGFTKDDAGLKVVPGSHAYRDAQAGEDVETDEDLRRGLDVREDASPDWRSPSDRSAGCASWHGHRDVDSRASRCFSEVQRRHALDCGLCLSNPRPSFDAGWITDDYEKKPIPGTEGLMSLY